MVTSLQQGAPGQCLASTDRQNGSASHCATILNPARSRPRSMPPIPEKRERVLMSKFRAPAPACRSACALEGAVGPSRRRGVAAGDPGVKVPLGFSAGRNRDGLLHDLGVLRRSHMLKPLPTRSLSSLSREWGILVRGCRRTLSRLQMSRRTCVLRQPSRIAPSSRQHRQTTLGPLERCEQRFPFRVSLPTVWAAGGPERPRRGFRLGGAGERERQELRRSSS